MRQGNQRYDGFPWRMLDICSIKSNRENAQKTPEISAKKQI
jgi:hypothetical protein